MNFQKEKGIFDWNFSKEELYYSFRILQNSNLKKWKMQQYVQKNMDRGYDHIAYPFNTQQ